MKKGRAYLAYLWPMILASTFLTLALAATEISSTLSLSGSGVLVDVDLGAYWDPECTIGVRDIDWGELTAGSAKTVEMYVRNEGNVPITLYMNVTKWTPESASQYMTLSWDREAWELKPFEAVKATFTLQVFSHISDIYEFSIEILLIGAKH